MDKTPERVADHCCRVPGYNDTSLLGVGAGEILGISPKRTNELLSLRDVDRCIASLPIRIPASRTSISETSARRFLTAHPNRLFISCRHRRIEGSGSGGLRQAIRDSGRAWLKIIREAILLPRLK
jgi:hypothetical protein